MSEACYSFINIHPHFKCCEHTESNLDKSIKVIKKMKKKNLLKDCFKNHLNYGRTLFGDSFRLLD